MSRRALLIAALIGCAGCQSEPLIAPPPPPPSGPSYEAIDLGTLGGSNAVPTALNDNGQVVGYSTTADGQTHAFLWSNGAMRALAVGQPKSRAEMITNSGLVAGFAFTDGGEARFFQWRNDVATDLGTVWSGGVEAIVGVAGLTETAAVAWTENQMDRRMTAVWQDGEKRLLDGFLIPGYTPGEAKATAMNGSGQIVGEGLMPRPAVNDVYHAFLWENGALRDLGVLHEFACESNPEFHCGESGAVGINDRGAVIGWSIDTASHSHAVLWTDGAIRDLGAWAPVVINAAGDIAGNGVRETEGTGYFWRNGILTALGSLGGGGTFVVDMNQGTVVGTSLTAEGKTHVFVWKPGESALTDLGAGVAVAINARGDVTGVTGTRAILWRVK